MRKALLALGLLVPLSLIGSQADAGILNDIQTTLTGSYGGFLSNSLNLGTELFGLLFVATCCVNIGKGVMKTHTLDGWSWVLGETFWAMIPPLVVLNGARYILPTLVTFIGTLAGQITGQPAYAGGPDAVVGIGMVIAGGILHSAVPANPLQMLNPLALFNLVCAFTTSVLVVLAFFWIGFELVFSYASALFLVGVGAAQIGWVAAPNTHHMAMHYTGGMVAAVWRCIVIIAWATLIGQMAQAWSAALLASLTNPVTFLQALVQMSAGSLVLAIGTSKVGNMGQSLFSGAPVVTASGMVRDIGRTVTTTVSAARRMA